MKRAMMLVGVVLACIVGTAFAISTGGPGGEWPKSWPEELEPYRKVAYTWQHEFTKSYDIPFATREEFEAAWPHLLSLKSEEGTLTLFSGPQLRVDKGKENAGVCMAPDGNDVMSIRLVVDGKIVDLNRIPLPADTKIIDRRFEKRPAE